MKDSAYVEANKHQINNIFLLDIPCKTLSSPTPICFHFLRGAENMYTQFSQLNMEKRLHLYIMSLLFPHSGSHPQSFSLFCPSVHFSLRGPDRLIQQAASCWGQQPVAAKDGGLSPLISSVVRRERRGEERRGRVVKMRWKGWGGKGREVASRP